MGKTTMRWYRLLGFTLIVFAAAGCFQQAGEGGLQNTPISQALPSDTPLPTNTEPPPPTVTPSPTVDPATLGQGGAGETTEEASVSLFPTFTAEAPLVVAQADEPPGFEQTATTQYLLETQPLYVTATAFILGATQTLEAQLTGTPLQVIAPTNTPAGVPTTTTTDVTAPLVPGATCIHEVRVEDRNLYRISLRYGTTVREIAAASGITNINLITVGQRLTIPGCGTLGVTPPATSTPQAGAVSQVGDGTTSTVPVSGGRVHIVEQGQTLFEISLLYGVPVNTIAAANGISNINLIYLGQELVIP